MKYAFKSDVENLRQARADAKQLEIFHQWSQAHPEFAYEAAHKLLQDYYHGDEWTLADLQESAERLVAKGVITPMSPPTHEDILQAEQEERLTLTNFIIANRQMQPETAKSERARFMNSSQTNIETLRQVKANIEQKRQLSALPKEQLQEIARGPQGQQYKPVPACYRTKVMLLDLASHNIQEFKQLIQRCGKAQIDAILAQRDEE